ncbi:MurR/RpiR family transcriptional regulator [uncultured Enorma sp.]|uniref:MurR/RpiR family transcriptional regulator n=1 Tax=uncultured Enorma sp. TaxID=1714346 RepID=UPI0026DC256C|nr:MurR/RpiR family transcriptional regulator [uncultured Enorma sp.]
MTDNGGVIQTICAVYDGLTPTDQRIANYILENRARIPDMTMREIANECQTSSPTVSRFVKRIGYENFAQMRLELARTESSFSRDYLLGSTTGSISFDRFNESLRFILSCKTTELTDTAAQIDPVTIKAVINLFLEADTVLITGVGNTLSVAANMAFKLRHLGVRAIAPSTTEYAASYSFMMTDRDVLVIISSSGISKRLGKIFDNAEDNGTPVVLITSNPQSSFVKRSKHVIMAYQRDRLFAYGVPFSHNSVNFVIEVLFLFLHASSVDAAEHIKLFSHTYDDLDKIIDFRSGEFIDLED